MSATLEGRILPVTPFQQNCMLLWDSETKTAAVVDPGGDLDRIEAAIAEFALRVEKILLTHAHVDHAAGAGELAQRLGVPIEGPHRDDLPLIEALPQQCERWQFPAPVAFTPDRWLDEGDEVAVGALRFDILHVPGHAPGHVVYVSRDAPVALVGDTLFQGSIGRTDLPGGDHDLLIRGIRAKLFALPSDTTILPGHGPGSTIAAERESNPFVADRLFGG